MRQQNLFEKQGEEQLRSHAPLADRMRPRNLEEFVGQAHLLGSGRVLERLLRYRQFQSLILWGPPGCGKTTLARIITDQTHSHLIALSAVMAGTREIRSAVEEARQVWMRAKKRTWLFMDEIHRLNKAQQDSLLPHVEQGTIILLGATTENPSFEIIRPLLSRAQVLVLEPLQITELASIIERALADQERGLGGMAPRLSDQAKQFLLTACGGDARVALNILEAAVHSTPPNDRRERIIDLEAVAEAVQRPAMHYDKAGEAHFNLISALHKSVRGSDPDATLYWLARMLESGEDALYIARRLVRMAVEDIGLADPFALTQTIDAMRSYQFLGSPEGDLALAQAAVYLALAPKSNTIYTAFGKARDAARKTGSLDVPLHLRNAPTDLLKKIGYGRGYLYPHDDPSGWVPETYLPDLLLGEFFYTPTTRGWEGKWRQLLASRRRQVDQKTSKQNSKPTDRTA
ncbi:MAG: replication-associated recombination protein A [Desulforhabdus sp.]|jgi:putative ATPase|nr:replication-associated recombination protein A [Desulforhabdus sp.]